jgi:very-short-patch-repair endonuclease
MESASALRQSMSLPEVILWNSLRASQLNGLRFRRQHPVGRYVLDFYCPSRKLAIEVDGGHHDLKRQMLRDRVRDRWLGEHGIRVLRVPAANVLDDASLDGVLVLIAVVAAGGAIPVHYVKDGPAPPPPPPVVPLPRFAGEDLVPDDPAATPVGVPASRPTDPPLFTGEGDHAQHGGGGGGVAGSRSGRP